LKIMSERFASLLFLNNACSIYTRQIYGKMAKSGVNHPARFPICAATTGYNRNNEEYINMIKRITA